MLQLLLMDYFKTAEKQLSNFSETEITDAYNQGYVLTRVEKGFMIQTRSLRIDLSKFELTSENRRILRKTEGLEMEVKELPLEDYSWEIHKMGKEFYESRIKNEELRMKNDDVKNIQYPISNFQTISENLKLKTKNSVMSAAKIKEMFQDPDKSNMTGTLRFNYQIPISNTQSSGNWKLEIGNSQVGYCLIYSNSTMLHYAYPFYDLEFAKEMPNVGLGMMIRAIQWAKDQGLKYVYLGSIVEQKAKYKLQFKGLEWWDIETNNWNKDLDKLTELLNN